MQNNATYDSKLSGNKDKNENVDKVVGPSTVKKLTDELEKFLKSRFGKKKYHGSCVGAFGGPKAAGRKLSKQIKRLNDKRRI